MEAITEFLDTWWGDAMDYHLEKFRDFQELFQVKKDLMDQYGYHSTRFNQVLNEDYIVASDNLKKFLNRLPSESVKGLVQMAFYHENQHKINPTKVSAYDFLADILTKEMDRKRIQLVTRIQAKAGIIVDSSTLYVGVDGNLNGVIQGDKERVSVHTIYAGGHTVQCLHYRILVKIL